MAFDEYPPIPGQRPPAAPTRPDDYPAALERVAEYPAALERVEQG